MRAFRRFASAVRARPGLSAIVMLTLAWGLVMQSMGWAQTAHFAQVRALEAGQAEIDPWHWETMDKAYIDGHFYSVKAPGFALVSAPLYAGLKAAGAHSVAQTAAENARGAPTPRWLSRAGAPYRDHGYSGVRARATEATIEANTPIVWVLGLFTAVLPAMALLLLVRWVADRLVPGYGTAAALTLGLATMVMTFATEYFPHVIATTLGFAAFALLMREREERTGPPAAAPAETGGRIGWVAAAGLLAGLAIAFEFPVGLVGVVLFFYALGSGDRGSRLRRGGAYVAGGIAGVIPVFAFNAWAFGSPTEFGYSAAVAVQGLDGHAAIGLNSDGFFGITIPDPIEGLGLLFAGRGLITLTPVFAAALAGLWLMRRSGNHRSEWRVIAAVALTFFLYNAGYWLPFGGGTPGPRFLIPILPFVAIGFAYAYKRMPAVTLGLAIPSALMMLLAMLTYPLIGEQGSGQWVEMLLDGTLEHTVLTAFGVTDPFLALLPVFALIAAAIALGARTVPDRAIGPIETAGKIVIGWMAISVLAPVVMGDPTTPLERPAIIGFVAFAGLASLLTLWTLSGRDKVREEVREIGGPQPALSDRIS